ncbi:MAG: hypothetical protein J0I96_00655 [Rhodanobacter sp.]|nr:hypothetical protein [Rhodanobacter sp.]ODV27904.1 MAG: hypothetical protein ABT19_01615 [Rhodanobacter sp. SCN 68-63]
MSKAKIVTDGEGRFYGIKFICPGCAASAHMHHAGPVLPVRWLPPGMTESPHVGNWPHWDFDGNLERPTLAPSVLSRWDEWQGDDVPPKHHVCHSFVRDGRIEFLTDCTHALAGQTVDLPEIEQEETP